MEVTTLPDAIFEYRLPGVIIYGWGALARAGEEARRFGTRALIVSGATATRGMRDGLEAALCEAGIEAAVFDQVSPDPDDAQVEQAAQAAREACAEVIVGFGGGSPLDVAKAAAGIIGLGRTMRYCLDKQPGAPPIDKPALPLVSIPTTAGTGSEITQNAVIHDRKQGVKIGLRSPHWIPRVAIVDPELTLAMPPGLTARTGADALTHALEGYVSRRATAATDATAYRAMELVGRHLRRAVSDGADREAREGMAMASMLAGMAFANSGVGAAHALSHPLGSTHGVPHGEACAVVLPYVMEHALAQAAPKFAEIARALEPERTSATPQDATASVRRLFADIGLPGSLKALGIERERLAELVPGVMLSGSLRNNPRPLTEADVLALLQRAWEG